MARKAFKGKGREIFVEDYDHAVLEYEAGRRRKEDRELTQGFSSPEEMLIIRTEPLSVPSPAPAPNPSPSAPRKSDRISSSSFSHRFKKLISSQKHSSPPKETKPPGRGVWKMYQAWDIEQAEQRKSRRQGISCFPEADLKQLELDFADPPTPPPKRQEMVIGRFAEIGQGFPIRRKLNRHSRRDQLFQQSRSPKSGSHQVLEPHPDPIDDVINEILDLYLQEEPLAKTPEDDLEEEPESPIDPMFETA